MKSVESTGMDWANERAKIADQSAQSLGTNLRVVGIPSGPRVVFSLPLCSRALSLSSLLPTLYRETLQ